MRLSAPGLDITATGVLCYPHEQDPRLKEEGSDDRVRAAG